MIKNIWIGTVLAAVVLCGMTVNVSARPARPGIAIKTPKMRVKLNHPEIAMELAKVETALKGTYSDLRREQRRGCKKCGRLAVDVKRALNEVSANWIALDEGRIRSLSARNGSAWWNKHILDFRKALGKPMMILPKFQNKRATKWLRSLERAERRYARLMPRIGTTINSKRSQLRSNRRVVIVRSR
jgi:hypothetical protein